MKNNNDAKAYTEAADRIEGCYLCHLNLHQDQILLCEHCNGEYHTYCLQPPLQSVPEHDWYCGTLMSQFILRDLLYVVVSDSSHICVFDQIRIFDQYDRKLLTI